MSDTITAELVGYNKKFMWLRVPWQFAHRILTLPRARLPRGFATANEVNVEIDYDTMRTEAGYYVADVELLSVRSARTNEDLDTPEGSGAS